MSFDGPTLAMIAATVVGPVAAVQAQKWLEKLREQRSEKLRVFGALMYTRGTRLSGEHVQALNRIELSFYKDAKVMAAWRAYLDNLNQTVTPESQTYVWGERDRLFVELLFQISSLLEFPFTATEIKNSTYRPSAHGDLELAQWKIMAFLAKIADGEDGIPVRTWFTVEQATQQEELIKFLVGIANGSVAWPVRDVDRSAKDSFK